MDRPSSPYATEDDGIEIADYATFQTSPQAHSPTSMPASERHSFDNLGDHSFSEDTAGLAGLGYSSPPAAVLHEHHPEHYESSTPASDEDDGNVFQDRPAHESGSSRSSVSSLPASVVPDADIHVGSARDRKDTITRNGYEERLRSSPFRHPSSVRAMQMDDELTPPSKRRTISRMSGLSNVSSNSPTKRGKRSLQGSPQKQKAKKEYPLVLLHCTLLPPSLPLPAGLRVTDQRLLRDLLPEPYRKRWKLLQDCVSGATTVKDRGILVPHPQGDYDMLEERILESLELVQPKVRNGHYLGADEVIDEENSETDETTTCKDDKCPDCGQKVIRDLSYNRTWEVKVYAANGMMRAGAWTAAWKEMERVDVEVSVWLPEEARVDLEQRLAEHGIEATEESFLDETKDDDDDEERRRREVYGETEHGHPAAVEGVEEQHFFDESRPPPRQEPSSPVRTTSRPTDPDFQTLLANYIMLLLKDPKNMIIAMLTVFVVFFAFSRPSTVSTPTAVVEVTPTPALSVTQCIQPSATIQEPIFVTTTVTAPAISVVAEDVLKAMEAPRVGHVSEDVNLGGGVEKEEL